MPVTDKFLLLTNSHDGTSSLEPMIFGLGWSVVAPIVDGQEHPTRFGYWHDDLADFPRLIDADKLSERFVRDMLAAVNKNQRSKMLDVPAAGLV